MGAPTMETVELRRYTEHLALHLVGPYARRSEILDEVMDGLQCAAADQLQAYPDLEEAARRAVLEWGAPGEVARAYNDATLRLSANKLSLRAVYALPLLVASWAFVLLASPAPPWPEHPSMLVFGVSVAALGGVLCLLGAMISLRNGSGIKAAVASSTELTTTATTAAVTGLILVLSAPAILLFNRGVTYPDSLNWLLVPLPAVLTLLTGGYFLTSLRRFLAARGATCA